jgi:uncharacterized protein (DUF4415 family)
MKPAATSKPLFSQAEIEVAIAAAPDVSTANADNPPTTEADWENAIVSHSLPELREKLAVRRRGPGLTPCKISTTIRLSPDVYNAFHASGAGWQTRIDAALKDWLKTHSPA